MPTYKGLAYDNTNVRNIIPSSSDIMQLLGGLQVDGAATITGNLTVNGTTTTVNSEIVTADRFLHMNSDYMADAIEDGGIVFTVDPENNELNGNLNIASTTTIVIGSDVTANFAANDIIQITSSEDAANDGLYVIHSAAFSSPNTTITIKDASTNTPHASVSAFVKTSLTTNSDDDSMKIRVAKIGVIKTDSTNGVFEIGFGSAAPITYNDVLTAASSVTASAIAADDITAGDAAVNLTTTSGNITIDASANDADIIFKVDDGGSTVTALTLDGSDEGNAIFVNDIQLKSDAALLEFGDDLDTSLTHVADTGLLLNSSRQLQFGDSATHIKQVSDSNLEVEADGSIVLDSPVIDFEDDGAILKFGDDSEVTLTHVADTGLELNAAMQLRFRDSAIHIASAADGELDLTADGHIDLNAPSLRLTNQATDLSLKDNEAAALEIKEAGNSYLKFITTNSQEGILLGGSSSKRLMFRDANTSVFSSSANQLDLEAAAVVKLNGTTGISLAEDSTEVITIDTNRKVEIGKQAGAIEVMSASANNMFAGSVFTGGEAIATALVVRMHTNGKCLKAASSSGAEARVLGVSVSAASGDGSAFQVATMAGSIVDATFSSAPSSSSAGLPCFLDTNSNDGKVTLTAPTGSGLQVVQVGFLVEDGDGSETVRRICLQVIDRGAVN